MNSLEPPSDPSRQAAFRSGAVIGFGTGFLTALVVLLAGAGLAFGMFTSRSWVTLIPGFFFLGIGRRGILRGLLLSAAITLTVNAILWLVLRR